MTEENVVHLPTPLERLAVSIRNNLKRDAANYSEWLEIQESICLELAEARGRFKANIAFGQWCEDNGFGESVLDHRTRAAAVAMGREPEALCECLNATTYRSLRRIFEHDWPRFTTCGKTPRKRTSKPTSNPSPEFEKAKAAYEAIEARGEPITEAAIRAEAGVSSTPVRRVLAYKEAEAGLDPLSPADMRATERKRFDIAISKARAQIREELKVEVYKELDVFVRDVKDRADRADKILAGFNGVISREAYRKIKACLHPDHNTFTHAAEALRLFSELEVVLVKSDDPVFSGPPLPTTAAELMARRRQHKR
jgi:hypothetical protein